MSNSKLNRHYHTHTKKLCKAPPVYPVPPPECWPIAIPGEVQSCIYEGDRSIYCTLYGSFVAEKKAVAPNRCVYEFNLPPTSLPAHSVKFILYPWDKLVDMWVILTADTYNSKFSDIYNYPINPGLSPHEYIIPSSMWGSIWGVHTVSRFRFTL